MTKKADEFKWFGEGFDGFPKRLPDDCVVYVIHVLDRSFTTEAHVRRRLSDIKSATGALLKRLLKDFIWQRDGFGLELGKDGSNFVLRGRTSFGDSIADEWLIVYILREITKQFPEVWIRVHDTDGEFLLIEAASALPKWLDPEIAEHRVWLNSGSLRIIPPFQALASDGQMLPSSRPIRLQEALNFIRTRPQELLHSQAIEEEAFYRIRNYPQTIPESLHHSRVILPRKLAWTLHRAPYLISPAVEAYYLRDPIAMKPLLRSVAKSRNDTGLAFPPDDLVEVSVLFTRVGFAQLRGQEFEPVGVWSKIMPKVGEVHEQRRRRMLMGMKVACGFEMLVSDPQNKDRKSVREINVLLEDLREDEGELPTDQDLTSWPQHDDDEAWLEINYEDFEKELAGKGRTEQEVSGSGSAQNAGSFGSKEAQENLRKIVERFEAFLNDEEAGLDGADDGRNDEERDEDDESSGSECSEDDEEVTFDEREFVKAVKQMMGMSPSQSAPSTGSSGSNGSAVDEIGSDTEKAPSIDEDQRIMDLSKQMEIELKASGALTLDPPLGGSGISPHSVRAKALGLASKGSSKNVAVDNKDDSDENDIDNDDNHDDGNEGDADDIDIDYNLAKNLLESFKGQVGAAGPVGTLMGAMGMTLPRDEPDEPRKG